MKQLKTLILSSILSFSILGCSDNQPSEETRQKETTDTTAFLALAAKKIPLAAKTGDIATLKQFIEKGIDVDLPSSSGRTPLILASESGKKLTTAFLIKAGANINAVTRRNGSALMYAANAGELEIVSQLITAGADIEHADNTGVTALAYAVIE